MTDLTDKEELIINLLLVDRLTCRNEIEKKFNNILTINSIFLGGIVAAFAYTFDKNIDILFIALPLLIFIWVWMLYWDLHFFYMDSKLICKIEDEINAIVGQAIMKRENFSVEFNKKHSRYNLINQFSVISLFLLIYAYCIHRSAIYLSERYPSFWIYLAGVVGIIFIIRNILYISSISDGDSKLLEEFMKKRNQKYGNLEASIGRKRQT
jgi:hypothetical protein